MKYLFVLLECVVVMFWNVENFFDTFSNPEKKDKEFTPEGSRHWTWRQFEKKRNGIAKTIIATADSTGVLPSVIGLAEVENSMVIRQLVKFSPLAENGDWGYVHRESPDARGIDVALLFRKDVFHVLKVDSLRINEFATRDILYVKGLLESMDTVHFLVNHWPSQLGGKNNSSGRRKAAANVLSSAIDSIESDNPGARIIVMGDFNTDQPDVPLVHPKTRMNAPGTIKYHGKWEKIDHFFTTENISGIEAVFNPLFLLEDDKAYLGVKPYRTFSGPRNIGGLSDHLPLLLIID